MESTKPIVDLEDLEEFEMPDDGENPGPTTTNVAGSKDPNKK